MTMKKFVSLLFATTLLLSIASGKGKEASKEDEGAAVCMRLVMLA